MIINANNYSLSPRRFVAGTKGSYGIETMNFEFSDEWDGLNITVTFFPSDAEPVTVLYEGVSFPIPSEVTAHPGLTPYTVVGQKAMRQLVSLTGYIDVLETTLGEGSAPVEFSPSVLSRVMEIMKLTQDIAQSVRNDADAGAFNGKSISSAGISSSGDLVFKRSDGVSFNTGNIIDMVIDALPNGDEVSF